MYWYTYNIIITYKNSENVKEITIALIAIAACQMYIICYYRHSYNVCIKRILINP